MKNSSAPRHVLRRRLAAPSSSRRIVLCLSFALAACGGTPSAANQGDLVSWSLGSPTITAASVSRSESFVLTLSYACAGLCPAAVLSWYRSTDAVINASDVLIESASLPRSAAGSFARRLNATAPARPGRYHYGACLGDDACTDGIEIFVFPSYRDPWSLGPPTVTAANVSRNERFGLTLPYACTGFCPTAILSWYRSVDTVINASDVLIESAFLPRSAAGSFARRLNATAPARPGRYHYGACLGDDACTDGIEIFVFPSYRDPWSLGPPTVTAANVSRNERFGLTLPYACTGFCPTAILSWYRSVDTVINASDVLIESASLPRSAAGSFARRLNATAPARPGRYHYGACLGDGTCTDGVEVSVSSPFTDCDFARAAAAGNPLECYQWHLDEIRVREVWALGGDGAGTHVSIVDDAGYVAHEDLDANLVVNGSIDYVTGSSATSSLSADAGRGKHGLAVAGLLAAAGENGVGVKGVAPGTGIYFSNYLERLTRLALQDALSRHTERTAVSSNSWGRPPNRLERESASVFSVVEEQLAEGYDRRGVSYVFAAGNQRNLNDASAFAPAMGRSDYWEMLNHRAAIPVCAVNADGRYASYSSPGTNLWICAPSGDDVESYRAVSCRGREIFGPDIRKLGLATTDLTGGEGYNAGSSRHDFGGGRIAFDNCLYPRVPGNNSYTRFFSGTSAAVPLVSGVIALMRAERPELSWRDIKLILAESAARVDAAAGSWRLGAAAYHNPSVRYAHSEDYGFGLIDAAAAWQLAGDWVPLAQPLTRYELNLSDILMEGERSELSIKVPADIPLDFIEYVNVDLDSIYPDFGALRVALLSPSGMESVFTRPHACLGRHGDEAMLEKREECDDLNGGFMFGTAAHLGEAPQAHGGRWTLRIDGARQPAPVSWTLRFWGHARPAPSDSGDSSAGWSIGAR